ncbi:MAG: NAD(P)/FAD-dependent oxidoreductase [Pseudotabrizicola sp.]|uniref:flavin monoamine oxidase family protein n=1 Tax=Pseudotabrizicola sp. TaxID=2939647 RepID=UPI00271ED7C7|nr:NAD(P)/FAD-dependent oxidoreductase [Pseudotabrizicola sp.]MDO8883952.1 NAD(P)/FAD-dependent oxidoreductase [Pseudotabrizicola sp.]MDP2081710.1 NAD(P)/FAD-dependent oxidoreductase [Pseudotabrizicola sp.]MDZ7574060.1 NAD(P)/FAD-dependent oxidoreductase [Pseudotabrizicola sp.]
MSEVDVVIVGAGAAGLGAAKALRAAGQTVAVLEAMDRIGGRAWTTTTDFGVPFDIGCAWLHAADRNPFFADARAAGWTLQHHDMTLDHLWFGSRRASDAEMAQMREAEEALAACVAAHEGPDDRLSSVIANCHYLRANSTFAGPMDFGADDDEISISDFKLAADLDPNYFTKEGFGALIHHWGADVSVTLNAPVRQISYDGPGVTVSGPFGQIRARAVIVTVSTGVLQYDGIRFDPPLPPAHLEAIFDLPMGLLTKIPLAVSGTRLGLEPFDDLLIERHARHDLFFLAFPFDLDLMVGFVGGDFAWEIEAAGPEAAVDFATDRLADIFGSDIRGHITHGCMTRWSAERHVRGAYAVARPGKSAARTTLAEPVADRIWFAGEALAGPLMQTASGARLSGESVAAQVVAQCRVNAPA